MKKRLPKIRSDKAAERLLKKDLSKYLNKENFTRVTFEFAPKSKSISLRLSEDLLTSVRAASQQKGISYQRYIRQAIEHLLREDF